MYITTPIYYVNDLPHLGTAYSTIVADVIARYARMFGEETVFLTGVDEHGQKVEQAARKVGRDPQDHVDRLSSEFQKIWSELGIDCDIFMRTTAPFHKKAVQETLNDLFEKGDIYLEEYEGWYCVSDEMFYPDKDVTDGKAPNGKPVQRITEKNYFFRMSRYQERLITEIEANPNLVRPEGKRREVLGFLANPLSDLCISRPCSRISWGIPLPFDEGYVTYVWFDALLNYSTAIGYKSPEPLERERFERLWRSATHIIGKDILIPHAVYWTTMLMALGLPLPKSIFAHGWLLNDTGGKMSKSEGQIIRPLELKNEIGLDSMRYYFVRDVPFGNDAAISKELIRTRVNADLANNLGNLLSRAVQLAVKYFDGKVPEPSSLLPETIELRKIAERTASTVREQVLDLDPCRAVAGIMSVLSETNRYIDSLAPWKSMRTEPAKAREAVYTTLETLRIAGILLYPVMPDKMLSLLERVGWRSAPTYEEALRFGGLKGDEAVKQGEPLFARV